jgi:hypothetical protein
MGMTIHYEGKYSGLEQWNSIIETATQFADRNKLDYFLFDDTKLIIHRSKQKPVDVKTGEIKMLVIHFHLRCDPFILQFDINNCISHFCKTQFAEPGIHILIIDLLEKIKPFFESFNVVDEGGYWGTNNLRKLQEHFAN